jgi:hypothetical protein
MMEVIAMTITKQDKDILRRLASEVAQIAAQPVHREKAGLWKKLNRLEKVRPLVLMYQVPWQEMNVNDELTLQTTDLWAQDLERQFRETIYQWTHFPADMIVPDHLSSPLAVRSTGVGLCEDVDIVKTEEDNPVVSRHFHIQISKPEDIEKIKIPKVTHDTAATEENLQKMNDLFGNILPVRKTGIRSIWFTPWDNLIRLWGVQEAMIDLVERPDMVHAIYSRYVDACMSELDQYESLNVLTLGQDYDGAGSGGYANTDELPGPDFDPTHVRPHNLWGCSNAQCFSEVSPEMHWEFAVKHDLRWLKRWGLTYYGCCEPLDLKVGILRRIPNLRKISMSPWINVDRAVKEVAGDYVFSYKPNPAFLAEDRWRPEIVRKNLRDVLEKTRSCRVEIILKDVSTIRHQPQRLWEWEKIAMEEVERL